jgi:hypothetical protein
VKISVVILNWNRPLDTVAAAESVLRQTYADVEVLLWDNASTDDSLAVLERRFAGEPRVRLVPGDANYGVAGGRNRAFPLTSGDIIFSLDSDAVIEGNDGLTIIANTFARSPEAGAISFEVKRPDGHLMWPFSRPSETWRRRGFETYRVDGCAFATRREIFNAAGGFAEHFSPYGAEDAHYAFKVIGLGHSVLYVPEVVVVHAFSPAGRNATQFKMHVRNRLLIPLELFPMPHALASYLKSALSLARDAAEQRALGSFAAGAGRSLADFRMNNRHGMGRDGWRRFRNLVAEEKKLAPRG